MLGLVCCYSGSGNTRLACEYLLRRIPAVKFDLHDVHGHPTPDLDPYGIVGFATFTDFWGVPQRFIDFVTSLPFQRGSMAFALNTFGLMSGATARELRRLVESKGFKIIAQHALHTPESFPPMIIRGMGMVDHPNSRELGRFHGFIGGLKKNLEQYKQGKLLAPAPRPWNPLYHLLPSRPRTTARQDMGEKYVDEALCTQCGTCEKGCPYGAIRLDPHPQFDETKCYGCWACFNHCPTHAIYTRKIRGRGHYPEPAAPLVEKLSR